VRPQAYLAEPIQANEVAVADSLHRTVPKFGDASFGVEPSLPANTKNGIKKGATRILQFE
jgi:hypothetical protein